MARRPLALFQAAAGNGRYQVILILVDVLVLVHQDMAEPLQQLIAHIIRLQAGYLFISAQQGGGVADQGIKRNGIGAAMLQHFAQGDAGQAHGGAVVGGHGNTAGIAAHQGVESFAKGDCRIVIEAQDQDAAGGDALHAQQIGATVHHHAGFSGSRAGQNQSAGIPPDCPRFPSERDG